MERELVNIYRPTSAFDSFANLMNKILTSKTFMAFQVIVAVILFLFSDLLIFVRLGKTFNVSSFYQYNGSYALLGASIAIYFFAIILILTLISSVDVIDALLPFMLLSTVLLKLYGVNISSFSRLYPIVILLFAALILRMVIFKIKVRAGVMTLPFFAVTLLVTISAVVNAKKVDPANRTHVIFYTIALGIAMLIIYLYIVNYTNVNNGNDSYKRLERAMIYFGVAIFLIVIFSHITNVITEMYVKLSYIVKENTLAEYYRNIKKANFKSIVFYKQWKNNVTMLGLFALPFPFFKAIRERKGFRYFLIGIAIYLGCLLTFSKTAIILGTALVTALTILTLIKTSKSNRKKIALFALLSIGLIIALLIVFKEKITEYSFISFNSTVRIKMWKHGLKVFKENFIFGTGIISLDSGTSYVPLEKGYTMLWYHNSIIQVLANFGIVGILVYGYFNFILFKTMLYKTRLKGLILTTSVLSVKLFGLVNPGIFSPIPSMIILIAILAVCENMQRYSKIEYNELLEKNRLMIEKHERKKKDKKERKKKKKLARGRKNKKQDIFSK